MVYQWYLFVILAVVAFLASAAGQSYTVEVFGRPQRRYGRLPVAVIAATLIILAGTRPNIGDTFAYRSMFWSNPASFSHISQILTGDGKDKGFSVLTTLLKMVIGNNDTLYFLIISAVCLLCVILTYRKYSCNLFISMFLFIASSDYIQWNYNGMRQFIAVAVIFAATDLLLQKKYLAYFAIVAVMSTIHASALIMIPISLVVQGKPWNLRTVLFTLAALFAINFSGALRDLIANFMADTQYSGEVDQFLETEGTNIFRVLVFSIPPLLALVFRRYLRAANDPLMNLSTNMSIVSMGVYIISSVTSGIFVGRIPIYFSLYNYILLPGLVETVFTKRSQKLLYGAIILCYLAFYCYQMTVAWDFSGFM